jgi:hypothetical protein
MRHAVPAALAAAAVLSLTAACDAPVAPPHAAIDAATLQPLLERLDLLVAALQARSSAVPAANAASALLATDAPGPASTTRTEAMPPQLLERLEAIERELARLQASSGARPYAAPSAPTVPKLAAAVATLAAQFNGTDEVARVAARRSLFRLTEQEVLQRLGMPDEMDVNDHGLLYWGYREGDHGFGLRFVNGVVADIEY